MKRHLLPPGAVWGWIVYFGVATSLAAWSVHSTLLLKFAMPFLFYGCFAVVLKALLEKGVKPRCRSCNGEGKVHHYGFGPFAELRRCSACSDGSKIADTLIPVVQAAPPKRVFDRRADGA